MDVGKVAVRILGLVLWVVFIIIDLSHKFYGIWSLVGYAVIGIFLYMLIEKTNPATKVKPKQEYEYWIVYHGTKSIISAIRIVKTGIKPGYGDLYGTGVYMTFEFDEAKKYAKTSGIILKLYIKKDTNCVAWNDIPGIDRDEKYSWCVQNGYNLIYIRDTKWFVAIGQIDVPVSIPGLAGVEVLDFYGSPVKVS